MGYNYDNPLVYDWDGTYGEVWIAVSPSTTYTIAIGAPGIVILEFLG